MDGELHGILGGIEAEAQRITADAQVSLYIRLGGVIEDRVDHQKLIADLGVANAAKVSGRLLELRRGIWRLYGLNPTRMVEAMNVLQQAARNQWMRS